MPWLPLPGCVRRGQVQRYDVGRSSKEREWSLIWSELNAPATSLQVESVDTPGHVQCAANVRVWLIIAG